MTRSITIRELADKLNADKLNYDVKSVARLTKKYSVITGVVYEQDGKRQLIAPTDAEVIIRAAKLMANHSSVSFDTAVEQASVDARSQRLRQQPADVLLSILAAQHAFTALTVGLRTRLPQRSDFDAVERLITRFQNRLTSVLDAVQIPMSVEESDTVGVQELALTLNELGHLISRTCAVEALLDGQMAYWQRRDDKAFRVFTRFVQAWQQLDEPAVMAFVEVQGIHLDAAQSHALSSPLVKPEPDDSMAPVQEPTFLATEPSSPLRPSGNFVPVTDFPSPTPQAPASALSAFFKQSVPLVPVQEPTATPVRTEPENNGAGSGHQEQEANEGGMSDGDRERLTLAPEEFVSRHGLPDPTDAPEV